MRGEKGKIKNEYKTGAVVFELRQKQIGRRNWFLLIQVREHVVFVKNCIKKPKKGESHMARVEDGLILWVFKPYEYMG